MFVYSFAMEKIRYPGLDLLRIFACLSVILYHFKSGTQEKMVYLQFTTGDFVPAWSYNAFLANWAEYGYLGVDVFFLLSGSVIYKASRGRSVSQFLQARIERLFLIYALITISTFLVLRFYSPLKYSADFALSDLFFSNAWQNNPLVIAVAWTLKIEIQFYLLFGLILWMSRFNQSKVLTFLIALQIGDWILNLNQLVYPLNFLNLDGYLPYFLTGAIIAGLNENKSRFTNISKFFIYGILFENLRQLMVDRIFGSIVQQPTLNQKAIVAVGSLFVLLFLARVPDWKLHNNRVARILESLAVATYPLYLLHQQVGLFLTTFFYAEVIPNKIIASIFVLSFLLLMSLILIKVNRFLIQKVK